MRLSAPFTRSLAIASLLLAPAARAAEPLTAEELLGAVTGCIDRLIAHGTDRYGAVQTPMFMSVIDVRTNASPREPEVFDAMIRSEGRLHRRNPGGADLWEDQPLLRAMYHLAEHHGKTHYADAADAYTRAFFERSVKENGLLAWGSHIYYDAYTDAPGGDGEGKGPNETLVLLPEWERMWAVDAARVRREADLMWEWHMVDPATGEFNRHDDKQPGCDFAFYGGELACVSAFVYGKTQEALYLERAKIVANRHWNARDPDTNLCPDAPGTGDRYDAHHCFTTITGPYAALLLRCSEYSGDPLFREMALAYLRAYLKHGWDGEAKRWRAMLALDGTPVMEQEKGGGYDVWKPTGYIDVWRAIMFSYEFPSIAAQSAVYAWEVTGDADALASAKHWAENIRAEMPASYGRRWGAEIEKAMPGAQALGGAYAEEYGRMISFFLRLHRAAGNPADLSTAQDLAREALAKLSENGWLKGCPAKPYYESTDGVGFLLCALLELAEPGTAMPPNF
ncbi:MAG: hypothetical protein HYV27_00450 [Candidatus Hydrogenedentes bacterium]|nr:hypothetical protein [Candidatus Hydrogenedentota bacterium]